MISICAHCNTTKHITIETNPAWADIETLSKAEVLTHQRRLDPSLNVFLRKLDVSQCVSAEVNDTSECLAISAEVNDTSECREQFPNFLAADFHSQSHSRAKCQARKVLL